MRTSPENHGGNIQEMNYKLAIQKEFGMARHRRELSKNGEPHDVNSRADSLRLLWHPGKSSGDVADWLDLGAEKIWMAARRSLLSLLARVLSFGFGREKEGYL